MGYYDRFRPQQEAAKRFRQETPMNDRLARKLAEREARLERLKGCGFPNVVAFERTMIERHRAGFIGRGTAEVVVTDADRAWAGEGR